MAAHNPKEDYRWQCSCCDEWHDTLPFSFMIDSPVGWPGDPARDGFEPILTGDQCVIELRGSPFFFVRGNLLLPVHDAPVSFGWGVWVSLSEANYVRMGDLWHHEGREAEPSYFGWLSSELAPLYPPTLHLKTNVHTSPVGQRPWIELEPTDHPLAIEQREGITVARVREIAEAILHPKS